MLELNKIHQGDCLEVMKHIEDKSIDCIITDPPFNLVGKMGGSIHLFRQSLMSGDNNYNESSMNFDKDFNQISWLQDLNRICKSGANIIIFNDWENMGDIAKELRRLGFEIKSLNHWQKTNPQPAEWKRRFVCGREYFLWAKKKGNTQFNVSKLHKGVFEYGLTKKSEKRNGFHPNQKPIKLMEDLINIFSKEGDTILDCFIGSGTTAIACRNLNRNFIGIELSEEYCKIANDRLTKLNDGNDGIPPKPKDLGILPTII